MLAFLVAANYFSNYEKLLFLTKIDASILTPKIPGPFLPISTSKTLIFKKNPKKIQKLENQLLTVGCCISH
jgi:hypothetical protein